MALREILAEFRVRFDPDGALQRGAQSVDRAKRALQGLSGRTAAASAGARQVGTAVNTITPAANQASAATNRLKTTVQSLGSTATIVKGLGAAFAGAFAFSIVKNFTQELLSEADAIGKTSKALGLATDRVQVWQQFVRESGGANEDFSKSYKRLAKAASEALVSATGPAARGFDILGVSVERADGSLRSTEELLLEVGGAIAGLEDQTQALAVAQDLLGRGAEKIIPGFVNGTEAAREQLRVLEDVAVVYSETFIAKSEQLNDELSRTSLQMRKVSVDVLTFLLPSIRRVGNFISNASESFRTIAKNTNVFETAITVLAGAGLAALITKLSVAVKTLGGWRVVLGRLLPQLALFAAAFLIIDDIITTLRGGDSVIRRILESFFGAEKTKEIIKGVNDVLDGLVGATKSFFQLLISGFSDESGQITSGFLRTTEGLASALESFIDWYFDTWFSAWGRGFDFVLDYFRNLVTQMQVLWSGALAGLQQGFTSVVNGGIDLLNKLPGVNIDSIQQATVNTPAATTRNVVINDRSQVTSTINAPTAQAAVSAGVAQANAFNLPRRRLATLNAVRQ